MVITGLRGKVGETNKREKRVVLRSESVLSLSSLCSLHCPQTRVLDTVLFGFFSFLLKCFFELAFQIFSN